MKMKTILTLGFLSLFSLSSVSEYRKPFTSLPYVKVHDPIFDKEIRLKSLEDEISCIEHEIYTTGKSILE